MSSKGRPGDATSTGAEPGDHCPIASAQLRQRVTIQGVVAATEVARVGEHSIFRAILTDSSGSLALVFLGRRAIPGLEVGVEIAATGILGAAGGHRVITNPSYHFLVS